MLLRLSLGLEEEAAAVEAAVEETVREGVLTGDLAAPGARAARTAEVGAAVVDRVAAHQPA